MKLERTNSSPLFFTFMKRDIDKKHDLTDPQKFKEMMVKEDKEATAPCGRCQERYDCPDPVRCKQYKAWRKKYMARRYG